jgi:hypothetical protein
VRGYRRAALVAELGVRAQVGAACGACHSRRRHATRIGRQQSHECWNTVSARDGKPDAIVGYDLDYVTIIGPLVMATSGSDRRIAVPLRSGGHAWVYVFAG